MSNPHNINLTFLGTASGGGPTETRNCSSLVVDALNDGTLWSEYLSHHFYALNES